MTTLLQVAALRKLFPVGAAPLGRARPQSYLHAVDDVSFSVAPGESVGLVGESGCGKSTLGRLVARLIDASDGSIAFDGKRISTLPAAHFARVPERSGIQMVFQDPTDSLDPRYTAAAAIAEPLRRLAGMRDGATLHARVQELARDVGLPAELLPRFPHQLSGGQKARVGIARAIAVRPKLLVLDEPTAALDVSVQAVVLHLLADLREKLGMSYLFVSHDLNIVRLLCHRVLVMYLGRIVESGPVEAVFRSPRHPYTRALVAAIPKMGAAAAREAGDAASAGRLASEPRSPIDPDPRVCRFFGRCDRSGGRCDTEMPVLREAAPGHAVACHHPIEATTP
jgi:peptide/nickel transport system ATP-binding protein